MTKQSVALFWTLACALSGAFGQSVPEEKPKAQLRVMVFSAGSGSGGVVAKALSQGMEEPVALPIGESYGDFPAGAGTYEFLLGDQPVTKGALSLKPKRAYSLIGWQGTGGKWQSKLFADDTTPVTRVMRVLNFVPNRPSVVSADQSESISIAPATVQEVPVPAKEVVIRASVQDPDGGPPFQTSNGFDFTQAGSAYLLIAPNYRGKPRLSLLAGGFEAPTPMTPVPAVAPPSAAELQKQEAQNRKATMAYIKATLADLEARERGPNKIPNADAIRKDLQKQLQALEKPTAPPKPAAVPPGTTTGPPR